MNDGKIQKSTISVVLIDQEIVDCSANYLKLQQGNELWFPKDDDAGKAWIRPGTA